MPREVHCVHLPVDSMMHLRRLSAHILHALHERVVYMAPSSPTISKFGAVDTVEDTVEAGEGMEAEELETTEQTASGAPRLAAVGATPTMDGWPVSNGELFTLARISNTGGASENVASSGALRGRPIPD
jgi:hypothetical protein